MAAIASPKQQVVFSEVKDGIGNIAVQATAGSGKSFTLIQSLSFIPRLKKTVFLSFSNAIVDELRHKMPQHIKASTLHSLGCKMLMSRFKNIKVEENKYFKYALENFEERTKEVYKKCFGIQDLCNYARLTLTNFDELSLTRLANTYGLDVNPEQIVVAVIVLEDYANLKHIRTIDFADMIYYPAKYPELVNEQYDYVCLDESQDMNNAQVQLVDNILKKPKGRIISVGDKYQAIYGFQGSSVDSFERLQKKFDTKVLPLTVTYRCAKKIVELAQTVYPEAIEAHPEAIEGIVRKGELIEAEEGDMIICRNTKPLVAAFFDLIQKGKKAFIVGKDYEKGLLAFAETVANYDIVKTSKNILAKLDTLLQELKDDRVSNPTNNPKYIALCEKADILELILQKCDNGMQLADRIKEIFHEEKKAIRLLTAHRSKGLENDRVFFIENFNGKKLLPSEYAVLDWQMVQESNLLFVVYTRAKKEFVFVDYKTN